MDVGHRRGGVCRDLRLRHTVPRDRACRWTDRTLRRAPLATGVRAWRRTRQRPARLRAGAHRRRHAHAGACTLLALAPGAGAGGRPRPLGGCHAGAGRDARLAGHADADGLVLHQGGAADLRRSLCGAALCVPGCSRAAPVAQRPADDRRLGARRDDTGPADHGGGLRRLRRRMAQTGARAGVGLSRWRAGRERRHLFHLPAVVRLHPRWRPGGRSHARQARLHRAAVGHYRGGGRRDPEPRAVLRVPRVVAAGLRWPFRRRLCRDRAGRGRRALSFQGRRAAAARRQRAGGPGRHPVALKETLHGRTHPTPAIRAERAARPVGQAACQPPPEQLRRRGQTTERHPHAVGHHAARQRARVPAQRAEARRAHRHELDVAARALLRQPGRRRAGDGASVGAGAREQLRQRRALARRVRRHGEGPRRWLRLGAAGVPAARGHARQPVVRRPHACGGRRGADPRAGHVRARLPHGLRRGSRRLRRCVHGQHRLGRRLCTLPGGRACGQRALCGNAGRDRASGAARCASRRGPPAGHEHDPRCALV
mmetsp:Transcript_5759/g.22386  ORF Transcript_5759/g.22386 Transcript_5759/m.22386 type:complete len:541 (-) Transcript_5759:28-1650(-)